MRKQINAVFCAQLILIYLRITSIPQFQSNVSAYFKPSSANDGVELHPMQKCGSMSLTHRQRIHNVRCVPMYIS